MENQVRLTFAFLILALVLPLPSVNGHDTVTTFVGDITGTVYLQNRVNIINTVTVTKGATLKIKPGSALVFLNPKAQLVVYGNIQALGDKGEPIYFESPLPDTSWQGVVLKDSLSKNIFKYCRFRRAKQALTVENSKLFIWQCRFYDNEEVLKITGRETYLRVKDNSFTDNRNGLPLFSDVVGNQMKFVNNLWSRASVDAVIDQTYNKPDSIRFSPATADPTNWTAR